MTYIQHPIRTLAITFFLIVSIIFAVMGIASAAEVTGTLGGNTGVGSTITGNVVESPGNTISGTVTGSVSSGNDGGSSGNGNSSSNTGSVLGVNTDVSNVPSGTTGEGSVLGVSTDVPNTGAGGSAAVTLFLILALSLAAGFGAYVLSRRVAH